MSGLGTRDPDALRRRADVVGDPDRDQHFLVDERVLDRLPGYLPVDADRGHLLEIGGGTGALTDRLLAVADRVTTVERDPTLATFLREEFAEEIAANRLTVSQGDALAVDFPPFTAVVSNLPYGIASEILFALLPERRPLVLTVQREFAERMAASVGDPAYGRLSVTAGHFASIEVVEPVPATAFDPQPAVESAIVRTRPREPGVDVPDGLLDAAEDTASLPAPDEAFFLRFVTAVFTQRRKTMRNAIRNTAHISELDAPDAVVAAAPAELLDRRAGEVSPAEFAALARLAQARGDPS